MVAGDRERDNQQAADPGGRSGSGSGARPDRRVRALRRARCRAGRCRAVRALRGDRPDLYHQRDPRPHDSPGRGGRANPARGVDGGGRPARHAPGARCRAPDPAYRGRPGRGPAGRRAGRGGRPLLGRRASVPRDAHHQLRPDRLPGGEPRLFGRPELPWPGVPLRSGALCRAGRARQADRCDQPDRPAGAGCVHRRRPEARGGHRQSDRRGDRERAARGARPRAATRATRARAGARSPAQAAPLASRGGGARRRGRALPPGRVGGGRLL